MKGVKLFCGFYKTEGNTNNKNEALEVCVHINKINSVETSISMRMDVRLKS